MDVKIEKITINLDGDKLELTLKQAKALKRILDETFGNEVKYVPFYTPPVVIREPYRWPYTWTVTVGDTHCFTTSSFQMNDIGQFSAQSS